MCRNAGRSAIDSENGNCSSRRRAQCTASRNPSSLNPRASVPGNRHRAASRTAPFSCPRSHSCASFFVHPGCTGAAASAAPPSAAFAAASAFASAAASAASSAAAASAFASAFAPPSFTAFARAALAAYSAFSRYTFRCVCEAFHCSTSPSSRTVSMFPRYSLFGMCENRVAQSSFSRSLYPW